MIAPNVDTARGNSRPATAASPASRANAPDAKQAREWRRRFGEAVSDAFPDTATDAERAARLGLDPPTFSRYKNARRVPSLARLRALIGAGLSPNTLGVADVLAAAETETPESSAPAYARFTGPIAFGLVDPLDVDEYATERAAAGGYDVLAPFDEWREAPTLPVVRGRLRRLGTYARREQGGAAGMSPRVRHASRDHMLGAMRAGVRELLRPSPAALQRAFERGVKRARDDDDFPEPGEDGRAVFAIPGELGDMLYPVADAVALAPRIVARTWWRIDAVLFSGHRGTLTDDGRALLRAAVVLWRGIRPLGAITGGDLATACRVLAWAAGGRGADMPLGAVVAGRTSFPPPPRRSVGALARALWLLWPLAPRVADAGGELATGVLAVDMLEAGELHAAFEAGPPAGFVPGPDRWGAEYALGHAFAPGLEGSPIARHVPRPAVGVPGPAYMAPYVGQVAADYLGANAEQRHALGVGRSLPDTGCRGLERIPMWAAFAAALPEGAALARAGFGAEPESDLDLLAPWPADW